jgi:hypothetical protein
MAILIGESPEPSPATERHWGDDGSDADVSGTSFWAINPTQDISPVPDLTASLFRDADGESLTDGEVVINALLSIRWGDYEYSPEEKKQCLTDALNKYRVAFYDRAFDSQISKMAEVVSDCMNRPEKPIGIRWRTNWLASCVKELAERKDWTQLDLAKGLVAEANGACEGSATSKRFWQMRGQQPSM